MFPNVVHYICGKKKPYHPVTVGIISQILESLYVFLYTRNVMQVSRDDSHKYSL